MEEMKRVAASESATNNKGAEKNRFPEYWPALMTKVNEMLRNGLGSKSGFQESLMDPGIHTLVIGIPGSGYETVASKAAILSNQLWICGDRLGYRSQTTDPSEWLYDLDSLLYHMKDNRTPSIYSFGGSGAANIIYLPWKNVIALYPENSEQYCRQVVEWRRKNGLSDLPIGFNKFAELENEFIKGAAELTATLHMSRANFSRVISRPGKVDQAVEVVQDILQSSQLQARQNAKHSLAAICENNVLYIRQRTSGKWMSSRTFGFSPEFARAFASCQEPLDGKTAATILSLIHNTPEKEQLFDVTTEESGSEHSSQFKLKDPSLWASDNWSSVRMVYTLVEPEAEKGRRFRRIVVKFHGEIPVSIKYWSGFNESDFSNVTGRWNMKCTDDMPANPKLMRDFQQIDDEARDYIKRSGLFKITVEESSLSYLLEK